jgi:hypothetical protein
MKYKSIIRGLNLLTLSFENKLIISNFLLLKIKTRASKAGPGGVYCIALADGAA